MPRSAVLERRGIGDVGREGDLARARLRDPDRLDRRVVVEVRARVQLARPSARRSAARAAPAAPPAGRRSCAAPRAPRRSAVFGPTPWSRRTGWRAKCATACSRLIATNAAGLNDALAVLATSREGPIPTDSVIPVRSSTSRDERAQQRDRQRLLGEVEVGLVDAGLLDDRDALADDRPDLGAGRAVGLEVGRRSRPPAGTAPAPAPPASPSRRRSGAPRSSRSSPPRAAPSRRRSPARRAAPGAAAARPTRRTRRCPGAR